MIEIQKTSRLFFFLPKESESAEQLPGRRITMVK